MQSHSNCHHKYQLLTQHRLRRQLVVDLSAAFSGDGPLEVSAWESLLLIGLTEPIGGGGQLSVASNGAPFRHSTVGRVDGCLDGLCATTAHCEYHGCIKGMA